MGFISQVTGSLSPGTVDSFSNALSRSIRDLIDEGKLEKIE